MTKPNLITKFFAIGTSGPTVDGRIIKPSTIDELAATYDPAEYTAGINIEHLNSRSMWGEFPAMGRVVALKARDDKKGRRVLLAQIEPSLHLQYLSQQKQKLFTSMEIVTNFAKTGKAYLIGLAMTDRPAALGVEALCFSANNDGPTDDRFKKNLFTQNYETEIFTMDDDNKPAEKSEIKPAGDEKPETQRGDKQSFVQKFAKLLNPVKQESDDNFTALQAASLELAQKYADLDTAHAEMADNFKTVTEDLSRKLLAQENTITKLSAALEATPEGGTPRPTATGEEDENLADC